jgi:tetratricopeptide (TPR) repeat protein
MQMPVNTPLAALALLLAAISFFAPPLAAQQDTTPGWPLHDSSPTHATADVGGAMPSDFPDDSEDPCLLWASGEHQGIVVNAASFQIPDRARDEYKKGCSDLKAKKYDSAEAHLRNAVKQYSQYSAAWALLGQILAAAKRLEDARDACSQATTVDAGYAPGYLCLADVAGQQNDWQKTLDFADRALALQPNENAYAHLYTAMAQFHTNLIEEAKRNAQEAIAADHHRHIPQAHLLLAQIYGADHDLDNAARELRAYLKAAPKAPDAPAVRDSLAQLEAQNQK